MQVVFVHGVNTRDLGDGEYERWVNGRNDRLKRLAFGGRAEILNPYWGKYGLQSKTLKSIPTAKGDAPALGQPPRGLAGSSVLLTLARRDFRGAVASMSVAAIAQATANMNTLERHRLEDFWFQLAASADGGFVPEWLPGIRSDAELMDRMWRMAAEPVSIESLLPTAKPLGMDWKPRLPFFDTNAFIAARARELMAGHLAQFLGDALMFFSRREQSLEVRRVISSSIVEAAKAAHANNEPLVLIGYSMGGGVLHEVLTDQQSVLGIESQLGNQLKVDLFLSVGTQIGMFAELGQFAEVPGGMPLAVPVSHYWNVFDYNDTLAFLCAPVIPQAEDLEVSTATGISDAHGAYFESALFFNRLHSRLKTVGLIPVS